MKRWKTKTILLSFVLLMVPINVFAQSSSSNYSIDEYFIGPGGDNDLNSTNYSARASLGDTGIGNSASTNYQLYGGFTTTDVPYIEVFVPSTTIDMGVLDESTTGTGTGTFSVRTYLADSYVVTLAGTLPTSEGGATIDAMGTRSTSTQGTEQYGLNLTTNTSPASFGADPVQVPSTDFSFGYVLSDYNVANEFKYVNGDQIAASDSSSGQTDYTVSYIINVSPITEAGLYTARSTFVVTSTF